MDFKQFQRINNLAPLKEDIHPETLQPMYRSSRAQMPQYFEPQNGLPAVYTNPRTFEPYASMYFGSSIGVVNAVEDPSFIPIVDRRVDPNKIFSADIQASKTATADLKKMQAIFGKRLQESLTEKGKVGLTEEDVLAMQAYTAANNAIVSSINQQVTTKKVIAELRIKQQQQQSNSNNSNTTVESGSRYNSSPMDIGRSMMDHMFETISRYPDASNNTVDYNAPTVDPDTITNDILPTAGENIEFESSGITTSVIVRGSRDETAEYVHTRDDGSIIDDGFVSPNRIAKIDRDQHLAYDDMERTYPLIELVDESL
jgi:hypothetical protein